MNEPIKAAPAPHADLANKIRDAHLAVVGRMKDTVLKAIEAGELLLVVKDHIPHGEFLSWLKANCGVSERSARVCCVRICCVIRGGRVSKASSA